MISDLEDLISMKLIILSTYVYLMQYVYINNDPCVFQTQKYTRFSVQISLGFFYFTSFIL